jgi:wyosine [tRNA(Phe)-imidazoG37] synthetase (radical SAM superfamily)
MSTFLFDDIVFGPVNSRRLGQSLGINLLPELAKLCNFNCVYCECGWTEKHNIKIPSYENIIQRLEQGIQDVITKNLKLDVITFAGNGEPTMHPMFREIIQKTVQLRNQYLPNVKIAVLTNATLINKEKVAQALKLVDMAILKLDSAIESTMKLINQPVIGFDFQAYIEGLINFPGRKIIQTMFLQYEKDGMKVDNACDVELQELIRVLHLIKPELVMIYSVARDTPDSAVKPHTKKKLLEIAKILEGEGFHAEVS